MTLFIFHHKLNGIRHQHGLSLVELMISMVIGLILLGGVTTLIVQQSQTRDELEKSSRQIENGRYAMQILHDDLQLAGFYGQYFSLPLPPALPLPNPCLTTTAALLAAMPLAIQGYDSPVASPVACIPDANLVTGTDILVIRRAATNMTTVAGAAASAVAGFGGQVYMQSNTGSAVIGVGTGANTATYPLYYDIANTIQAPLRPYWVHIYFVSPCSVPADGSTTCTGPNDDNGNPIPTLKRMELGVDTAGNTSFNTVPLVEGIENMQLDYGVDGDNTVLPPSLPIDGYPDIYCTNPDATCPIPNNLPAISANNPTNWAHVMSVRINLLARNNDPTVGFSDVKTYNLGIAGTVGPFNADPVAQRSAVCLDAGGVPGTGNFPQRCNYKRHVFSELVRIVNSSGRRAKQ